MNDIELKKYIISFEHIFMSSLELFFRENYLEYIDTNLISECNKEDIFNDNERLKELDFIVDVGMK
jgi:hypothetical protein